MPNAYPLVLELPAGCAYLVLGSAEAGAPRYECDGQPVEVDVTIPEDLEPFWHWFGSYLCQRPQYGHAALSTFTHGLPAIFDVARGIEARRAPVEPMQMAMWE